MAIIKISDFSKEAASKTKGLVLKEKLLEHLDDADLAVDFTGIEMFASPFFNNSFLVNPLQIIINLLLITPIITLNVILGSTL